MRPSIWPNSPAVRRRVETPVEGRALAWVARLRWNCPRGSRNQTPFILRDIWVRFGERMAVSNSNDRDGAAPDLPEDARRIEAALVLAVASEPPEALGETIFGLDDAALRRVVALTLAYAEVTQPIELSLLVTDDAGLRTLNREYRGKDEPTDVLSFPLLDAPLAEASADQLWQYAEDENEDDGEGL